MTICDYDHRRNHLLHHQRNHAHDLSARYTGAISVSCDRDLEAIATATGYTTSAVAYRRLHHQSASRDANLQPGRRNLYHSADVTISDTTPSATIYYTTNGTTPTTSSTVYSGAITVSSTETLEAIATATGYSSSAVASAAYTINLPVAATPTFSVAAGTYTSAQTVTISDTTPSATIYYTTNGTTPTTSSSVYCGAITVSSTETLEAIATATGYTTSAVPLPPTPSTCLQPRRRPSARPPGPIPPCRP